MRPTRTIIAATAALFMLGCTTTGSTGPNGRPQKSPGEVAQEQAEREGQRVVRSTTSQILRAPGRAVQRQINCIFRGGC